MESPDPQSTEWIAGKTRGKYWDKVGTPVAEVQVQHNWNTSGTQLVHTHRSLPSIRSLQNAKYKVICLQPNVAYKMACSLENGFLTIPLHSNVLLYKMHASKKLANFTFQG